MLLNKLFENIEHLIIKNDLNIEITDIIYDSRKVINNSVFVCLKGANCDGHEFINKAIEKGASAIVIEDNILIEKDITVIKVKNTRLALAYMSAAFFGYPSNEIKTIGITGTKGKTTTSCMIKKILECENIKTGLIGTLGIVVGDKVLKTNNTTPESYEIQKALRNMVDEKCKCVVIEASSLGLKWHRIDGFVFDYGVFTNFSEDHLGGNEHENMDEYAKCKSILFQKCKKAFVNIDDQNYKKIIKDHICEIETFGFSKNAKVTAKNERLLSKPGYVGVHFDVYGNFNMSVDVDIPGKFSVYNALAALVVCKEMKISDKNIQKGLNTIKVKGRVESVKVPGDYTLLIDYAHNAVSMENILNTLREYHPNRLITLFGAGGDRPKNRRYEMGEISGKLSDLSVITADNSRNEDVKNIISDIKIGINKTSGKYVVIEDRKEAIKYCIKNAKSGDIIVLAGKGHEDYQEISNIKYHFDEREIIADILREIGE